MDVFYQMDCRGNNRYFLGVIDDCSLLHMVTRVVNREAAVMWNAFRTMWLVPFGLPLEVICDADGSFMGEFQEMLDRFGVLVRHVPAEAHYQMGRIERHNFTFKLMLGKLVDHLAIFDDDEFDEAVLQFCHAKNSNFPTSADMDVRHFKRPPAEFHGLPQLCSMMRASQRFGPTLVSGPLSIELKQ
jgi:hypothetical protein